MRYPIFFLAFGPPLFRPGSGVDITKGQLDLWSFFQAGLLSAVALWSVLHLATTDSILIPKQIRSILRLALYLGLLYLASTAYSPSRLATAAYSILNFFTLICVVEFIADAYRNPPNWIQCLFELRAISLILFVIILLTLAVKPDLVMAVIPGAGIRLIGGAVAPVPLICATIAIISAYSFLHSLESRGRSISFFIVGLAGTLLTQARGCELSLFGCLAILAIEWAKTDRRITYVLISGLMVLILLFGISAAAIGPEHIWKVFNRGESVEGITSASGRTEIWAFVIKYSMTHPLGMGYVDGFRVLFRQHFSLGSGLIVSHIGNTHNTFVQVLADAGWLALAIYLIMTVKIIRLAWRFAKKQTRPDSSFDSACGHGIRCSLLLLLFCIMYGMGANEFSAPLRAGFYFEYIVIAIILGASARMLVASRAQHISLAE
jgi:O-antigen ligase